MLPSQLEELRTVTRKQLLSHKVMEALNARAITVEQYAAYLMDVYHYAGHSPVVIASAGVRLVHSNPTLAEYAFRHAAEEIGHDVWARSDLIDLGYADARIDQSSPSPSCERMIALEYFYACHDNPAALFGWMYVLECLGGDVGGTLASAIDSVLSLEGKGTYFLRGHGQADTEHSKDLTEVIANAITKAEDEAAFVRMAHSAIGCYLGILDFACLRPDEKRIAA